MLEPKEKIMLERAVELAEDSNKIVRKMYRAYKWGRFFNTLYWVIVIGTAVGAYYFIQPYVESVAGSFGGFSENIEKVKGILHTDKATTSDSGSGQ